VSARVNLGWRWRRLRAMGGAEIVWRTRQAVAARLQARGYGLARPAPPVGRSGLAWVAALPRAAGPAGGLDPQPYRDAADRVLAGRFDVFALRDADLGFPPDWNTDPKTGRRVPLDFGKRIDYRDAQACGDIKYLWEPNRHLDLVTLAQAWHLGGDERHAQGCRQLLDSWFEQCPYPLGPNWTSSLEHGIRLVNWAIAWHLLGGDASPLFRDAAGAAFRERWLRSVHQHAYFIAGWLSRHSSANNHLLGETLGLAVSAITWPLWPESRGWRALGLATFERESLAQTAPDGVNREQALWYQHAVMEMMLIGGLFARRNGADFGPDFWQRLAAMMEYVAALTDRGGHLPMLGDSDDSRIVRWDPRAPASPFASLLGSGAVLFGRADWLDRAGGSRDGEPWSADDRNVWLLGEPACVALATSAPQTPGPRRRVFESGGHYLLGARFRQSDEVLASFDAGPLGYRSIAAHGHADALSLTLSAGGHELLIDPGTYAYHTDPRWRDHFRSTFAHNTVTIDALDQSVSGGSFLWLRKATTRCLAHALDEPVQQVQAEHDGYARLADPVVHRRRVCFESATDHFTIEDEIDCRGEHCASLCWQLAEDCEPVLADDGSVVVRRASVRMTIRVIGADAPVQVLCGQDDPPAGWVSREFDRRRAAPLLLWRFAVSGPRRLTTRIHLAFFPESGPSAH
jgi:hypothetical protein